MLRRELLAGLVSAATLSTVPRAARASARTPYGGRLVLHAPWPLGSLDPHRSDDATAAFFGPAVFDTLYARDPDGGIAASLAEGDPTQEGASLRIALRPDLRFASGARIDARTAAASIARARAHDAGAWLAEVPAPKVDKGTLLFAMRDAHKLVRALASPMVAIVPPRFAPDRPDGTGPLRADFGAAGLVLTRNVSSASGPAFLDAIEVRRASDLATSLRAFESGADDVGWLGSFLHEPRAGARSFDAGAVGWAVLRTGRDLGAADVPGTAQSLADGVPHAALASLVVGPPWEQTGSGWTGAPVEMVVRDDSPWLVELARALAAALSSPGHEVRAAPVPAAELASRRTSRGFALMLDVARPTAPGPFGALVGLASADDSTAAAALVRHPPRADLPVREMTRTMRLGVVGEMRLQGGRAPDVVLPSSPAGGVSWGDAFRARPSLVR